MFNMKICLKNLKNIPNYAYSRLQYKAQKHRLKDPNATIRFVFSSPE